MIKKGPIYLFIVILLSFTTDVFAQNFRNNLMLGYTLYPVNSPDAEVFFTTYNEVNAYALKEPFSEKLPMMTGFYFATKQLLAFDDDAGGCFGFDIGFGRLNARNEAVFNNGTKRLIRLRMADLPISLSLGYVLGRGYITFDFGIISRYGLWFSAYDYGDKLISYGDEYVLNGLFQGWRIAGDLGLSAGIPLSGDIPINIFVKADYVFPAAKGDLASPETFHDNIGLDFNASDIVEFPRDMHVFSTNMHDDNNLLRHDMNGLRISFGLSLSLEGD